MRENLLKQGRKLGLAGAALVAFVNQAMAAVPEAVSSAIAETKTDSVTVAGLMIGVVAGLLVFKFIRQQMH
jgi:ammonia channel protein AmtB